MSVDEGGVEVMKAIMVCVDYSDILSITLPYNRHHFDEVMVVTSWGDKTTQTYVSKASVMDPKLSWFCTDSFYEGGASFNKWKALEEGLDVMGRDGWICIMDADVLWPKGVRWREGEDFHSPMMGAVHSGVYISWPMGSLVTPTRRMWDSWPTPPSIRTKGQFYTLGEPRQERPYWLPDDGEWNRFPLHRNLAEFAGYSQIFHASDPVLGPRPWHQVDWKHAGGADSIFQSKWPSSKKVRPPFEVLHLGPAGQNWYGRATPMLDGTIPKDALERRQSCADIWTNRRGKVGEDRFAGEKLSDGRVS